MNNNFREYFIFLSDPGPDVKMRNNLGIRKKIPLSFAQVVTRKSHNFFINICVFKIPNGQLMCALWVDWGRENGGQLFEKLHRFLTMF